MALIQLYTDVGLMGLTWCEDLEIKREWCENNCNGWFGCDILSNRTRWSFNCELDATGFKLRWL